MIEMKYFKAGGLVRAFRADGSEDAFIPQGAVAMTPDEIQVHLNPPVTKSEIVAKLNLEFSTAMADLQKPWPDAEAQTWTFQAEEARQWIAAPADAKPATPFLSSLHAQRDALGWEGTLEDLVKRVIHNTTVYTAATASLIGRRHVAEAAIEAAEDPASVTWDFNLTEPVEG